MIKRITLCFIVTSLMVITDCYSKNLDKSGCSERDFNIYFKNIIDSSDTQSICLNSSVLFISLRIDPFEELFYFAEYRDSKRDDLRIFISSMLENKKDYLFTIYGNSQLMAIVDIKYFDAADFNIKLFFYHKNDRWYLTRIEHFTL